MDGDPSSPITLKYQNERKYKPEMDCCCASPLPRRLICIRCLSTFSLLGGPLPGRLVSIAEYQLPDFRIKCLLYLLLTTAVFIPLLGVWKWNNPPRLRFSLSIVDNKSIKLIFILKYLSFLNFIDRILIK